MTAQRLHSKSVGDGPVVVLLHPVGLDLTCWDSVVERLKSQFRMVTLDLRGHGDLPAVDLGMTLSDYAADVHHTLDQTGIPRSAVVGLSFGGMVAQTLALDHPGTVSRLVLAGCTSTLPEQARPVLAARGRAAVENGMASVVEETLARWFSSDFIARGSAEAVRARLLRTEPSAWESAWSAISRVETYPRLSEISVPTLCIAGEADLAAPPAVLEAIARRVPGAELVMLPGAPHLMQEECPAAFTTELQRFLQG